MSTRTEREAEQVQAEIRRLLVQWVIHTRCGSDAGKVAEYIADLHKRARPIAGVHEVLAGAAEFVAAEIFAAAGGHPAKAAGVLRREQKRGTAVGLLAGVPEALADLCAARIVSQCEGRPDDVRGILADAEREDSPLLILPGLRTRCRTAWAEARAGSANERQAANGAGQGDNGTHAGTGVQGFRQRGA